MSTRETILVAIGMLVLGLLLGGLSGGIAGYALGQNAQPMVSQVLPTVQAPAPQQPQAQQPTPQPTMPSGRRGFPPLPSVINGAQIEVVEKDSPAEKAGLKVDDIITAVGSTKLDATHSLADLIQAKKPGDKVELSITRGTQTLMLTVELGASPDDKSKAWLGIRYFTLTPGLRRFPNG